MVYNQPKPSERNRIQIGDSRSGEWRSCKLNVYRDHTDYLTVALIEQARNGHPRLDGRINGLQVLWDPRKAEGDLRLYALSLALSAALRPRL
jgi:hypothetical protein